ncbi:MAG: type II toxin-antitoxin system HicB family antitoxin [Desulfatirhabdiaceae bacterium]
MKNSGWGNCRTIPMDHPEIMSQGETIQELEENLKEAYHLMILEDVPDDYHIKEVAL